MTELQSQKGISEASLWMRDYLAVPLPPQTRKMVDKASDPRHDQIVGDGLSREFLRLDIEPHDLVGPAFVRLGDKVADGRPVSENWP